MRSSGLFQALMLYRLSLANTLSLRVVTIGAQREARKYTTTQRGLVTKLAPTLCSNLRVVITPQWLAKENPSPNVSAPYDRHVSGMPTQRPTMIPATPPMC